MIQNMIQLHRLENENEEQFIWRLGRAKDSGELDMEWDEIANVINRECREDESEYRNESAYRKVYQAARRFYERGVFKDLTDEAYAMVLQEEQRKLKIETQKLRDERNDYQRSLREKARQESFLDLVENVLSKKVEPFEYKPSVLMTNNNETMIVCLSDLHAGIEVKNLWNVFNTTVLKERLHKYLDAIRDIQRTHGCKNCDVVLGGDNISGLIHPNLRLENNENVIEQVKIAATYIGDFIFELQDWFTEVRVHSVSGNHSRLSPSKEEHLRGEELDALIPFILDIKFSNNPQVKICEDGYIDNTINTFTTDGGKLFYVVHGDKDQPSNVVQKLTLMTGIKPDGVIMSHRHHNAFDTQYGTKVVQVGCVVGTDDHCVDLRISGEPEQCVIISDDKRAIKCIYDIGLK